MGRKMFAYLGYLYCPAEEWSMTGSVLSQIQVSWNMEYLEVVRKWSRWLPTWIYLNSIICNSLGMESGLLFLFLFFFLEKINPLSLADITWILWSFDWEDLCGMNEMLDLWLRGRMSGKSGCPHPEWVTDRPDIFGLANDEYMRDKDL